jgi:hypothetical protein
MQKALPPDAFFHGKSQPDAAPAGRLLPRGERGGQARGFPAHGTSDKFMVRDFIIRVRVIKKFNTFNVSVYIVDSGGALYTSRDRNSVRREVNILS